MKILILDDNKSRLSIFRRKLIGAVVKCVENTKDCIYELNRSGPWDAILLDHDLDGKTYVPSGPGTGFEIALWLKENSDKKPDKIILHTLNKYGAQKMLQVLPEAVWLSGLFLIDFSLSNLPEIENVYRNFVIENNNKGL